MKRPGNFTGKINEAIFSLDHQGCFVDLSPAIEQVLSYTAEELTGQPIARLVHPDDLPKCLIRLRSALQEPSERFHFRMLDKGGQIRWVRASIRPWIRGEKPRGVRGSLADVTQAREGETPFTTVPFRDALTGLYTPEYFDEELKRLDTPRQLPLTVVLGDVNGLELINDLFGRQAGDQLLSILADVLRQACRQEDVIARLGGDEFGVFLPKTAYPESLKIIDRIRTACRNRSAGSITPSLALGAVTKDHSFQDIHALINEARGRVYGDKRPDVRSIPRLIPPWVLDRFKEKNYETEEHIIRLRQSLTLVGLHLHLPNDALQDLALFASLHDIGKIALDEKVISEGGRLTMEEWRILRKHPVVGFRIASYSPELAGIADAIISHHERWDGKGYPTGLKGEKIPLMSRILSIAHAYDDLVHPVPGLKAISSDAARDKIRKGAGIQFDPALVDVFLRVVPETSGYLAGAAQGRDGASAPSWPDSEAAGA
jgi:diguanylate cyclase (GGDEF)-like protein/PAS domain S-box-containing protein